MVQSPGETRPANGRSLDGAVVAEIVWSDPFYAIVNDLEKNHYNATERKALGSIWKIHSIL